MDARFGDDKDQTDEGRLAPSFSVLRCKIPQNEAPELLPEVLHTKTCLLSAPSKDLPHTTDCEAACLDFSWTGVHTETAGRRS